MAGAARKPSGEKPRFSGVISFLGKSRHGRENDAPGPRSNGKKSGVLPLFADYAGTECGLVSVDLPTAQFSGCSLMAVQNLSGIESMLQQMREAVRAASAGAATSDPMPVREGFASELQRTLQRVSSIQNASMAQAQAFELGEPGVSLNDVMIDLQKAGLAFQTTLQVRNRLIAAYQEIANMPV